MNTAPRTRQAVGYLTAAGLLGSALGGEFLWAWFPEATQGRYFLALVCGACTMFLWAGVEWHGTRHRPQSPELLKGMYDHMHARTEPAAIDLAELERRLTMEGDNR